MCIIHKCGWVDIVKYFDLVFKRKKIFHHLVWIFRPGSCCPQDTYLRLIPGSFYSWNIVCTPFLSLYLKQISQPPFFLSFLGPSRLSTPTWAECLIHMLPFTLKLKWFPFFFLFEWLFKHSYVVSIRRTSNNSYGNKYCMNTQQQQTHNKRRFQRLWVHQVRKGC